MFTGIITDTGRIRGLERRGDLRVRIATGYAPESLAIGASVACHGICLTVVDRGADAAGGWFDVEISAETAARSTAGEWAEGDRLNLERALAVGDELGGHIVAGHVDGTAEVLERRPEGDSVRLTFRAPEALAPFIAPKGSVALDGISLTVNEVAGTDFGVNVIPHTRAATTWDDLAPGGRVNLEIDTLARYVARLQEWQA